MVFTMASPAYRRALASCLRTGGRRALCRLAAGRLTARAGFRTRAVGFGRGVTLSWRPAGRLAKTGERAGFRLASPLVRAAWPAVLACAPGSALAPACPG